MILDVRDGIELLNNNASVNAERSHEKFWLFDNCNLSIVSVYLRNLTGLEREWQYYVRMVRSENIYKLLFDKNNLATLPHHNHGDECCNILRIL